MCQLFIIRSTSGDAAAVAVASAKLVEFKKRHIQKLENDNEALAEGILEWEDRNKLNAGIRKLAAVTGIHFRKMWNELYKNLQYKYGIWLSKEVKRHIYSGLKSTSGTM